jgi:hypothetical protein
MRIRRHSIHPHRPNAERLERLFTGAAQKNAGENARRDPIPIRNLQCAAGSYASSSSSSRRRRISSRSGKKKKIQKKIQKKKKKSS